MVYWTLWYSFISGIHHIAFECKGPWGTEGVAIILPDGAPAPQLSEGAYYQQPYEPKAAASLISTVVPGWRP